MCCFSPLHPTILQRLLGLSPLRVSKTSIFARQLSATTQGLIYELTLAASADVAMILPLPVAQGAGEDGVRFVSLAAIPTLFAQLREAFPLPVSRGPKSRARPLPPPTLAVHRVGAFDASFVPSIDDFSRLDMRFRLPVGVWERLPSHQDFGFAVFMLRRARLRTPIHPMAMVFRTRDPDRLFFPTVHVHDGEVHTHADFDHDLYLQPARPTVTLPPNWMRAPISRLSSVLDPAMTEGLLDDSLPLARATLRGRLPNQDTWVSDA